MATNRTKRSSLKGNRFRKSPPPRATIITSTSGSWSRTLSASMTSVTHRSPCIAACWTLKDTSGQRRVALVSTSFSASESLPVTKPIVPGRKGNRFLRSRPNRPSAARAALSFSSFSRISPKPVCRIWRTFIASVPPLTHQLGLTRATTRSPGAMVSGISSWARRQTVMDTTASASGSLSLP